MVSFPLEGFSNWKGITFRAYRDRKEVGLAFMTLETNKINRHNSVIEVLSFISDMHNIHREMIRALLKEARKRKLLRLTAILCDIGEGHQLARILAKNGFKEEVRISKLARVGDRRCDVIYLGKLLKQEPRESLVTK
jgi:hypothetical protein